MWCLIGLGNPGPKYDGTRHNVGFEVIDSLSKRWSIPLQGGNPLFEFGSGDFRNRPVLLAKPMTYMNRSGDAYRRLLRDPAVSSEETLVIYDELHLPLGRIRVRARGSAGGHNGLQSIIDAAGTQNIPRMRIGIEGSDENWIDYVLSPFTSKEREIIDEAVLKACDAVESIIMAGLERAMNAFNRAEKEGK